MALMGGEAGVTSEPGQGARFWLRVTLPLAEAAGEGEAPEAAALRVLYADDHHANRILIQAMLGAKGHACDLACDGAEAVRMAEAGGYDLILMDIQMPVLDGVGAACEIRALDGPEGRVPILALTANTLSDQVESYRAAGMQDCIAKPVNMAELLAQVARWGAPGGSARARAA
jgi:CheY-like chemotaxis protein